ncbi:hypothetical protein R69619_03738 [Paraburkholderia nemoris]|uniref:hypothetical protein n=1 Tax=Paraburkholderia nemoris TaxID=2793076 RepID=UPI00190DC9C2|nr:hypothetical protein [Paraburkholderia nemoris]MBK3743151.1 hypothetical protein [Paraburkholderia aspalathi]CAE6768663.1 hypothetical protein R69619_03738 [Paraburkholderia nemoris]
MANGDDSARSDGIAGNPVVRREKAGKIVVPRGTTHVCVNDAVRAVANATGFDCIYSIYGKLSPAGEPEGEILMDAMPHALTQFLNACRVLGINPHSPYTPFTDDYTGTPTQNALYVITLDEYVRYGMAYGVLVEVVPATAIAGTPNEAPHNTHHESKLEKQVRRILAVVRELGYDPLALPKPGRTRGARAAVREVCLTDKGLFTTSSFNHVWQGLRDDGILGDADKRV